MPEVSPDWQVPGFDLDGITTDGTDTSTCETASIDGEWHGERGIDAAINAVRPLIEYVHREQLDRELARAIAERRIAIAIQLRGVTQHGDGLVEVALLALDADDAAALARDADGRPLPGAIVRAVELVVGRGAIVGTRVHVRFPAFSLARADVPYLPFADMGATDLAFDIVRDDSGPAFVNGVLGTTFSVEAIMRDLIERTADAPEWHPIVRNLLLMAADIDPDRREPLICARLSVGFEVEAVPAVLE